MINLLLLIVEVVFGLDVTEEVLEGTNHVTVEANAYHLHQDLVQVLNCCVTLDVSVAD